MSDHAPLTTPRFAASPDRDAMSAALARHWWAIVLRGVIAVAFGVLALAAPVAVLLSLALLFGIYMLVDGGIFLVASARAVVAHGRWFMLLAEALLNIL